MLVPTKLINTYLKRSLTTDEIVTAFERTEIEVEKILETNTLSRNIVTAKVLKVWPHPNADRLRMAKLQLNKSTAVVVCGAPNLEEGMVVAYAKPKSILPSGDVIEHATIRGQKSAGMLCSEYELGRSDDHSGIAVLDPDLPLGISLCDIDSLGDVVDIETPANRPDLLSIIGLAREVSANSDKNQLVEPPRSKIKFINREVVKVKETKECKRFVSVRLKINHQAKSPKWLVDNLMEAGMRSVSAVVDITNFVMLETGQPSHAYDWSKLKGNLQVRFAKNNEELTTLDGNLRKLTKSDLVIADGNGVIGLAGVMGGQSTEVDVSTSQILLEVANFSKATIRRMAIRHGLRSEASGRYEKGLPLPLPIYATERLLYLLQDICGAEIVDGPFDQLYDWPWIQHIGLQIRTAERFLGVKLDEKQLVEGLKSRGFEAEHFSMTKEARKHLDKPYKWGANYKQDGTEAFDCSYLIDYIYSLIGVYIGHTALAQFEHGKSVEVNELKPGDVVFYKGKIEKSVDDHYYLKDNTGKHIKRNLDVKKEIGHNGIYIGQNKVIMAAQYEYKNSKWVKRNKQGVLEVPLNEFTNNPEYLGARRYVDNFNHTIAVTAPWWREDVKIEQDLYEEAAKIVGYENMPATLPQLPPTDTLDHQMIIRLQEMKNTLVAKGLFEVMTYSFVSQKQLMATDSHESSHLKIVNPMSVEQEYLRSNLFMSHLKTVVNNRDYWQQSYGFFEISRVYKKSTSHKDGKTEEWRLAITTVGENSIENLKVIIDAISQKYHWSIRIVQCTNELFENGRSAKILVAKKSVGEFGQVSSKLTRQHKILTDICYTEINIDAKLINPSDVVTKMPPNYQLVNRDITIEVDDKIWWQNIVDELTLTEYLKRIHLISEYTNDLLKQESKKRISFRVWLDCGPNPNSKEISRLIDAILVKLKKHSLLKNLKIC